MTSSEHESAVAALGYTGREAAFLTCVARHGGYFVRRQYLDWIGRRQGQTVVDFTDRMVKRRHATVHTFCRTTHVYHVCAKALYAGIDDGPARRRRRPAVSIKARLMALDAVSLCPDVTFLATEAERLALCDVLGVDRAHLPQWQPPHGEGPTRRRYFPDALLLGVQQSKPVPVLVCAYIDDGVSSTAGFTSYLRRHARLFEALRTTRLIYVSDTTRKAEGAAAVVRGALTIDGVSGAETPAEVREDIREFFHLRRAYDAQEWSVLDTAKLDRLRALRRRFERDLEGVYQRWLINAEAVRPATLALRLESLVLPHSYAAVESWRRRS